MFTKKAMVGLVTGEPMSFFTEYGELWKGLSDRVSGLWRQTGPESKLLALAAALGVALLFLGSLLLIAWFLFPLIIFGAFLKAVSTSMGKAAHKG